MTQLQSLKMIKKKMLNLLTDLFAVHFDKAFHSFCFLVLGCIQYITSQLETYRVSQ